MFKKLKNNKAMKWIALILFCIFSINFVVLFLDIGLWISEYLPTSFFNVFIERARVFKITEYLDLWLSAVNIVVTAILSFLLLKVSSKSNEISEKVSSLEESRDTNALNDNIAFVYYQIVHSFDELHRLYIDYFILNKTSCNQIKIHSDWITTLSKLQSVLSISEIDIIYQLFVDIESVNNSKNEQKEVVKNIYQKYMLPCFFDAKDYLNLQEISPITMLHPEMISIIIFLLFSFKKNDFLIEKKGETYNISDTDNNFFCTAIELSKGKFKKITKLTYRDIILDGNFSDNRFMSGKIRAHYKNTFYDLYDIAYESKTNYHVKLYNHDNKACTGNVILDADYKSNTFDVGFLLLKKGEELWKGTVKHSEHGFDMLDGTIYHKLVEDSVENYNYDAEVKWVEEQLEMQEDPKYLESVVAAIDKEEPIGYKVYEDFIYKNGMLEKRVNLTKKYQYADFEN